MVLLSDLCWMLVVIESICWNPNGKIQESEELLGESSEKPTWKNRECFQSDEEISQHNMVEF